MKSRDALIVPSDFIKYIAKVKKCRVDEIKVPPGLFVTYQTRTYERVKSLIDGKSVAWWAYGGAQPFCVGSFCGKPVGAIRLFIGASAAVTTLEELIVCGAKLIFEVGFAGGLQPSLEPGSVVVIDEAFRDEGTSRHYFPAQVKALPSNRLKKMLIDELVRVKLEHSVGSVWSIDAVYRETCRKFRKFRKSGVLCVDMETSAVFTVAKYRGVEAVSVQVISDVLSEIEWQPHFFTHRLVRENTDKVTEVVLRTLAEAYE